ncbi:hypothetical protein K2X33_00865 [bacterium]|nr:hypothetical protein [bacterium]
MDGLTREQWLSQSRFEPLETPEVIDRILLKIRSFKSNGRRAFVLLDLDSTLYEVAERSARILRLAAEEFPWLPEATRAQLSTAAPEKMGYSIADTWCLLGLEPDAAALEQVETFWRAHFFSNAFLCHDQLYEHTFDWVHRLYAEGAEIVYLTGRDIGGMHAGTLECLRRDGLPLDHRTHLCMKDNRERDDVEHKTAVAERFAALGEIVASFENEPRNFVALRQAFPDALHVFVDTISSRKMASPVEGVYRMRPSSRVR